MFRQIYGIDSINVPYPSIYNRRIKQLSEIGISPTFTEIDLPPLDVSQLITCFIHLSHCPVIGTPS